MMRCSMWDGKKDTERLYCAMEWDYTLKVMGPATAAAKDKEFKMRVYGVNMVKYTTAGNFGVGLTTAALWASSKQLVEYKTKPDSGEGIWGGKLAIDVTSVSMSNDNMRASSDITINLHGKSGSVPVNIRG